MKMKLVSATIALMISSAAHAELVIEGAQPAAQQAPVVQVTQSQSGWVMSSPAPQQVQQDYSRSYSSGSYSSGSVPPLHAPQASRSYSQGSYSSADLISQSGPAPSFIRPLSGWANDVPLALALQQVVPSDFVVKENGVRLSDQVSWSGNRPWVDVLAGLAQKGQFVAHINWDRRTVSLAPNMNAPVRMVSVQPAPVRVMSVPVAPTSSRVVYEAPVVVNQRWSLDPSLTLRENVEAWAKKAGWSKVVWDASDYVVVAPAAFDGEFASKDGPLAKLIQAYEFSDQPLIAKLSTMDRVVHVTNKYYERNQVVPTSPQELAPNLFNKEGGARSEERAPDVAEVGEARPIN